LKNIFASLIPQTFFNNRMKQIVRMVAVSALLLSTFAFQISWIEAPQGIK
jgi:hypothetical protein